MRDCGRTRKRAAEARAALRQWPTSDCEEPNVSHLTASATGHPESLVRHARWFLFILHVPAMVFPSIDVAFDLSGGHGGPLAVVLAAVLSFAAGGIQLPHFFSPP